MKRACVQKCTHALLAAPADITVQFASLPAIAVAQATFPLGSTQKPGAHLYINQSYSQYQLLQKVSVLVHELGHSVGFRHTNWQSYSCNGFTYHESQYDSLAAQGANLVSSTPSTDASSVMNACTGGNYFNGFSHYDSVAVMKKYSTISLVESNNGTHPVLTGRYPRGAISALVRLETSISQLDDNWATTFSERDEHIGYIASGGQLEDSFHPIGYNNCGQNYDWPFEQDRAYYALRLTDPEGTVFVGIDAHALGFTDVWGWECWNGQTD